jgi:hypothetical protein
MSTLRLFLNHLLSYIPTPLPLGMPQYDTWVKSIEGLLPEALSKVPLDDKKFVLASAIQRLGPVQSRVSKQYFVRLLIKAAATQVASQVFMDVKERQAAVELAAKQQAEATANQVVANGQNSNI